MSAIYGRWQRLPHVVRRDLLFVAVAVVLAGIALIYPFDDYLASIYAWVAVEVIILLGFNVLFGSAGQMAFSHIFFVAIGAYVSSVLMLSFQVPFVIAGLAAMAVSAVASTVFAVFLLRLRAFYLAVASLILPLFVGSLATAGGKRTGGLSGLGGIQAPVSNAEQYLALTAVLAVVCYWAIQNLTKSAVGRAWAAVREDETAATALGVDVYRYKVYAYVLSSVFASLGGFLFAPIFGYISPTGFGLNAMLPLVMASVVGGMAWAEGAIVGAFVLVWLPELLDALADVAPLIYAGLLLLALRFMPEGIVGALKIGISWVRRHPRAPHPISLAPATVGDPPNSNSVSEGTDRHARSEVLPRLAPTEIRVESVHVRFGGLDVLENVELRISSGSVRGLIGPNGAGKTTLFNVISGFVRPDSGEVWLGDRNLTAQPPSRRAPLGIARTFQATHVFEEMSVLENVLVGMHVHVRPSLLASSLQLPGEVRSDRTARALAEEYLDQVGLHDVRNEGAKGLPFGTLKRLEIARALAVKPRFLLLDEPAGGLHASEIEMLEKILSSITEQGIGVLLVEHNVPFVLRVCHHILVLDHGHVIADGPAAEIVRSPAVIEAYLGTGERQVV